MLVAKRCLLHFINLKIPQYPLVNSQSNTKEKLLQLYQSLPEKVITDFFLIKCYKGDLQNIPIKFYFKMMNQSYIGPLFVKSAIILKWIQQSFNLIASNYTITNWETANFRNKNVRRTMSEKLKYTSILVFFSNYSRVFQGKITRD